MELESIMQEGMDWAKMALASASTPPQQYLNQIKLKYLKIIFNSEL